jgi:RimJ/RimL family protein N-acetyltransferase
MPGPEFLDAEAVSLHTVEEEDLPFLQEWINDRRIRHGTETTRPANGAQEEAYYEEVICGDETVDLLVVADGSPVGMIGFAPIDQATGGAEVGYWIAPPHQRQGYATDALARFVRYGFEQLRLHRIEASVYAFNDPSATVLERVGFVHEGTRREAAFVDGDYHDVHWYGLLEPEWRATERGSVD